MYDTVKGADWLGEQDAIEHVPQRARGRCTSWSHWGLPVSPALRTAEIYQRPFGGMTTHYGKGTAQRTVPLPEPHQATRCCIP